MAKSKGFFGLRRGSTKSLTFSVLRGEQITKDRVSIVSNPQSLNQAVQRSIFAAAAKFYQKLQFILNHSWEGVKYGTPSQSEFMRRAVKTLLGTQLEKGADAYPFNYEISDGSLPAIGYPEKKTIVGGGVPTLLEANFGGADESISKVLLAPLHNSFLRVGDNITFVGWDNLGRTCAITWTIPEDTSLSVSEWEPSKISGSVPPSVDTAFDVFFGSANVDFNNQMVINKIPLILYSWKQATLILSRYENGAWRRSPSAFVMDNLSPMDNINGAKTYAKGYVAINVESVRQLNTEENWMALIAGFDLDDVRSTYTITKGDAQIPVQQLWEDGVLKAVKFYAVKRTYNNVEREYLARPNGSIFNWSADTFAGHTELLTDESVLIPVDSVATGSPLVEKVVEVIEEGAGSPHLIDGTLTMNE